MNTFLFADQAKTTLASSISSGTTTITVASGTGSQFPNPSAGQQFAVILNNTTGSGTTYEIAYCTSRSGDAMTVTRGQEGTTATSFSAGDAAFNGLTAGTMTGYIPQQAQLFGGQYLPDTSSTPGVITVTLSPIVTSYSQIVGMPLRILLANTNSSGVGATINVNGLGTVGLYYGNGDQPPKNAFYASQLITVVYNSASTSFDIIGGDGRVDPLIQTIAVGSSGASNGTIGVESWELLPGGKLRKWCTMQLADSTNVAWTFKTTGTPAAPVMTLVTGVHYTNLGPLAGQSGSVLNSVGDLASIQTSGGAITGVTSVIHSSGGSSGNQCWYQISVEGY